MQQPLLPATTTSTSGAHISIMVIIHGDFTGSMATISGKISKTRSHLFVFPNSANNAIIYFSYLMTISEDSMEEEVKVGDDSQENDFISLSRFELLK